MRESQRAIDPYWIISEKIRQLNAIVLCEGFPSRSLFVIRRQIPNARELANELDPPREITCHETNGRSSQKPRHVPSDDAVQIANRAHFGEILSDVGDVEHRLRAQSRPQTEALDSQPRVLDGLSDRKSTI
jgi:hypothetical protein